MAQVVIFTDAVFETGHIRAIGAYRTATELRKHGYTVQVIDHFSYLTLHDLTLAKEMIDKFVGPETLMLGFSTTFFNPVRRDMLQGKQFTATNKRSQYIDPIYPISDEEMAELCMYAKAKSPGLKIVAGGANTQRHEGPFIDAFIIGYSEKMLPDYLRYLQGKNPFFQYKTLADGRAVIDYNQKAEGFDYARSTTEWAPEDCVLPGEILPMEIARGCIFRCKFCAFPLNGKKGGDHIRDPDVLRAELISNYERFGTTEYIFADDTYNDSVDKVRDLHAVFTSLPFKLKFTTYLRLDLMHAHPETISLLHESGLVGALFGIETLNWEAGKSIGKGLHPDKVVNTLHQCRYVWGDDVITTSGFIIGLPHETVETVNGWVERIMDPAFPLHAWYITALGLNNQHQTYRSEFELNASKYGYRFPHPVERPMYWENDHFTSAMAHQMSKDILKRAMDAGRIAHNGFSLPMIRNIGIYPEPGTPNTSISMKRFEEARFALFNRYLERLRAL